MKLKRLELTGFKSFAKKTQLEFLTPTTAIVGPNGSGKSNVVEAIRFVLGEQSMKSLRGKGGTDLIFKGSKNLSAHNRASVSIVFDNTDRSFTFTSAESRMNLDFEEITITREVFSDGGNTYRINGSEVRLKDIIELLASAHIGSSGHHIISQGEADRILSASNKDRRIMIEDALGLKIYQYRIRESERKLEKTKQNIKEVQAIRREITPHIAFLKKQVEKVEKAEAERAELRGLYSIYVASETKNLLHDSKDLESKKHALSVAIAEYNKKVSDREENGTKDPLIEEKNVIAASEQELKTLQSKRSELGRQSGRLEGIIEGLSGTVEHGGKKEKNETIPRSRVVSLVEEWIGSLDQALSKNSISDIHFLLRSLKDRAVLFLKDDQDTQVPEVPGTEISGFKKEYEKLLIEIEKVDEQVNRIEGDIRMQQEILYKKQESVRVSERMHYEILNEKNKKESELQLVLLELEQLKVREGAFAEEIREGSALLGIDVSQLTNNQSQSNPYTQEELKKKIERIKIKLEDTGTGGGTDILKEYDEVVARDQFLTKELADLDESMKSLLALIRDLKTTLDTEFKQGIEKINKEFQHFFSTMFGGGMAFLTIIVEHKKSGTNEDADDEETVVAPIDEEELHFERGIEINVSLPQKKVKDLHMLSGGERSLTSIALLFAMSQVNPPPFLVLDETDAALDEANSRRYGDMIDSLSKYSQLVVVTHNRETMSRAQVLYGVTIGADGGSKLLSIKFEEAVSIAK